MNIDIQRYIQSLPVLIGRYKNGNYEVKYYSDGSKSRKNDLDNLTPEFAESMDVMITKKCSQGCPFCYEGCSPDGHHMKFDVKFMDQLNLHPFTEIAINGNDMDFEDFDELLKYLKSRRVFTNVTFHMDQFWKNHKRIAKYMREGLIFAIGISVNSTPSQEFLNEVKKIRNCVIHTVNGLLDVDTLRMLKGLKVLVLGYKNTGRGVQYANRKSKIIRQNQIELNAWIPKAFESKWFKTFIVDNLAISQLPSIRESISDKEWSESYMGDEGSYTFYIDLVDREYGVNSISTERFPIGDKSVDDMFKHIRKISGHE